MFRGISIRLSPDFSKETLAYKKELARNMQNHEKQGPTAKIALPGKAIIQNQRADKELPREEKTKGVHQQTIIILNVKGIYLRKRSKP